MIPKIIHYCWFGGNPLPELAQRCIASWRKFFPDYEIWEWTDKDGNGNVNGNEDSLPFTVYRLQGSESLTPSPSPEGEGSESESGNRLFDRVMTFDVNMIPYTAEAYRLKKYAFVSDYARFWIMYRYGGIYFDTDVEVIRPMDDIIAKGNFMGFELDPDGDNMPGKYAPRYCFGVNPGVGFGITKEHSFMLKMLNYYSNLEFNGGVMSPWFKTIVAHTTEALMEDGLENKKGIQQVGDITVYPHEYFAPINVITGRLYITPNTYTIHRYMGSWSDINKKRNKKFNLHSLKMRLRNVLPEWVLYLNNRIKRRRYRFK